MTDAPPPPPPLAPPAAPPVQYYAVPRGAVIAPTGGQQLPPGYYVVARRPTNVLAIIGFVLSLIGLWFLPIVGSIAAIVLAVQARKQMLMSQEEGGGLATAALVIGWVGLGMWVIGAFAYIAFLALLIAAVPSTY